MSSQHIFCFFFKFPNYCVSVAVITKGNRLTSWCVFYPRANADAGPSVQHSERPHEEAADFVKDPDSGVETEGSVEASSGDEEAKDEGGEGKKKKPRSGFRDRKVINTPAHQFGCYFFSRMVL